MKFGMRTPSIKRSIKARTTGKITRTLKGSVNPLYGKKGMGYISNPSKALYNKAYNKTSFSVLDLMKPTASKSNSSATLYTSDEFEFRENFEIYNDKFYFILSFITFFIIEMPVYLIYKFLSLFSDTIGNFLGVIALLIFITSIALLITGIVLNGKNKETLTRLSSLCGTHFDKEDIPNVKYTMSYYFENICSSFDRMLNAQSINEFYYEQEYVTKLLKDAIKIECLFVFETNPPSEILTHFNNNKSSLTNEMINRIYDKTLVKIESLKTSKAKKNNADKFLESFEQYLHLMTEENKANIINLHTSLLNNIN